MTSADIQFLLTGKVEQVAKPVPQKIETPPPALAENEETATINALASMGNSKILEGEVQVDQKFLINSRADLNQLVPFKYQWAWEKYLSAVKNEWQPQEVNMNDDIALWKSGKLSEAEIRIVKRSLGFFSTADSLVANNLVLAVYKQITAPECRQYLLRQAYEEAVHCYAEGTEILTENGFKDFKDLGKGELVAQYHEDGSIDFAQPTEIIEEDYEGDMHRLHNSKYELLVTPNHRCFYHEPRVGTKLRMQEAKDLNCNRNKYFPVSGTSKIVGEPLTPQERLLVAFQADGSLVNKHTIDKGAVTGKIVWLFTLKKERKIERLKTLLEYAGVKWTTAPRKHGFTAITVWVDKDTYTGKDFGWVDVATRSPAWISEFVSELSLWDGCPRKGNSICYTNTNRKAVDKVSSLLPLAGLRAGLHTIEAQENQSTSYQLHIYESKRASDLKKQVVPYKGTIHCVSVPSGIIVVRYKDKVAISGNSHAYQYCIQSLNMDEGEMFNMYRVIPSISKKAAWTLRHTKSLADPMFSTKTTQGAKEFLSNLIGFYCVVEGMFFYCGFAQILSMGRNNKMTGVAKQFEYILKDESMHLNFGIDLINAIIRENPEIWDEDMQRKAKAMIVEGTEIEIAYAEDTMPTPTVGLSSGDMEQYLKFIADRRLSQIGLSAHYHINENPITWMSEIIDLKKEQNFFEGTVTDYQTSALNWG